MQVTLYTRGGYGAVVKQLENSLLVQWKKIFESDRTMKLTVGWQLHKMYHNLPVYKELPGCLAPDLQNNVDENSPDINGTANFFGTLDCCWLGILN